jgi:DNA-binding CsgD family transcriptional regulator
MNTEDIVLNIVSDLNNLTSDNDLLPIITKHANRYGAENFLFGSALYHNLKLYPEVCIQTNYPEEWQQRYNKKEYFDIDLTVAHCKEKTTPIIWPTEKKEISKVNKKMFSEASDFGITSGISFPCHSTLGEYGALAVSTSQRFRQSDLSKPENLYALQILSSSLFDIMKLRCRKESKIKLTEREKECLRWVVAGKTSWEIATIVNISERTVIFHIKNAASKMDTASRTSASLIALLNGEIEI